MNTLLSFRSSPPATSFVGQNIKISDQNDIVTKLVISDFDNRKEYSEMLERLEALLQISLESIGKTKISVGDDAYRPYEKQYLPTLENLFSIGSSIATIEPKQKESDEERGKILTNAFKTEFKTYSKYVGGYDSQLKYAFKFISKEVAKINFTDCLVELTPNKAFKIKILLSNGDLLVISKPFETNGDLNFNEVVFSVFQNKICLLSGTSDIFELIKKVNDYLDSK